MVRLGGAGRPALASVAKFDPAAGVAWLDAVTESHPPAENAARIRARDATRRRTARARVDGELLTGIGYAERE